MSGSNLNEEILKLKSENIYMTSDQLKELIENHGQEIECLPSLQIFIEKKQVPVETVELFIDIVKKEKKLDQFLSMIFQKLN